MELHHGDIVNSMHAYTMIDRILTLVTNDYDILSLNK